MPNEMTEEEYMQMLEEYQNQPDMNMDAVNFDGADKFLSDEVNYTSEIIKDEVYKHVQPELKSLLLKKRTLAYIDRLMRATTTQEIVINNYSQHDIMSEKIGVKKNTLFAMTNISALEKKYCDVDSMLVYNNVHHRTKVTRGRAGFERGAQKTQIVKSHSSQSIERPEPPKTGISRYGLIGRK